MEKALEMGKTSASGSFQLLIGVATSTVIMAVGTIILGRIMTVNEYGLYGVVLIPSTMINLFRDWGINSAMTKYIASFRVSHKDEQIHDVIAAGLIFEVATGLALSFLSLFMASFIASTVFHRSESTSYIAIVSVSIISGSLLVASQSGFVGFERMGLNSFTLICQSIVKTAVGPVLVLLGYGVLGAVIGYTLSFIAAGVIGLAIFYLILFRPIRKKATNRFRIAKTLKTMLKYGVPLSVSFVLGGILAQFYAFMIASFVSDTMYGNYLTTLNFSVLLTFLTIPISTVLFPAFAKLDPQKDHELVRTVYASSIKYASLLLVPATMAVMALSGPMIGTLYGEKYVYGPFFLTLYVIGNLFSVFGSLSSGGLLSGLGETRVLMKQGILTLAIGLPFGFLLIPTFGIVGAIVGSILAGLPSMFWVIYWVWKHYEAKADFRCSAKIFAASALAAVAAYLPTSLLGIANWIKLIIGLVIFLTVYILGAPLIGAVCSADLDNLRAMFSDMGIVSKIISLPLDVAEKAAQIRSTTKKTREDTDAIKKQ
jgi:O-antigen/teichoic acid export membrane protein